ncbi:hypothetical protein D3C81_1896870 [compost metagenome]
MLVHRETALKIGEVLYGLYVVLVDAAAYFRLLVDVLPLFSPQRRTRGSEDSLISPLPQYFPANDSDRINYKARCT